MKCKNCIDCEHMVGNGERWRCYGQDKHGELKRDLCEGKEPPETPPAWCPRRMKNR